MEEEEMVDVEVIGEVEKDDVKEMGAMVVKVVVKEKDEAVVPVEGQLVVEVGPAEELEDPIEEHLVINWKNHLVAIEPVERWWR